MEEKKEKLKKADELRKRAEEKLRSKRTELEKISDSDTRKLIHEFQVHQIELEMQNEELRKTQVQLEESHQRYSGLYDFAPVGYLTLDEKGLIQEVNLTAVRKLGVERGPLLNKPFSFLIHIDDRDIFYLHLKKVFESKTKQSCEVRLKGEEGIEFNAQVDSILWEDSSGNNACRTSVIDVTKRKQAEEFTKSILESIGEGLVVVDQQYRIITANKAFCNHVKMPAETIKGRHCYEVSHHINKPCYEVDEECPAKQTFTTGKTHIYTHRHYDKEGTPVYVEIRSYPMKDTAGNVISAIEVITDITKTVGLEKALKNKINELKESQERFQKISTSAQDAIVMVNNEDNISYWNPAAEKIFGYTEKEANGRSLHQLIVPDKFYEKYRKGFKRFKDTGQGTAIGKTLELSAIKKNGIEFPVELSLSSVKIKDSWNAIGIIRDITERKKAERNLRLLATVVSDSNDAITVQDLNGKITSWNKGAERMYGYTEAEVVNKKNITEIVPDDKKQETLALIEHIKMGELSGPIETKRVIKSGRILDVCLTLTKLVNDNGNVVAVATTERDITERKRAEEKIKLDSQIQSTISSILQISLEPVSLEKLLEHILNKILSIPWLALESKGCIYLVEDNSEMLVMKVQYGLSEALLSTCSKVPFGKCLCGRAAMAREILFADHIDDTHETRYQGMRPHGHYCIPILSSGRVFGVINLYVKEGHKRDQKEAEFLLAVANTLAGIIERKKAEESLQKAKDELELRVQERTAELTLTVEELEHQITERQRAEESMNKQKEKFISILIHDLKGPLVPVLGFTKRLIDGKTKSEEDKIEALRIIEESSQDLFEVIQNISQSLKKRAALQSFNPKQVELSEILISVIRNALPEIGDKGIKIFINSSSRDSWNNIEKVFLKADPTQLKTLIENLLGNAIKYARSAIKIELNKTDTEIQFTISDDGPGIHERYHDKIYEEYFQVPGSKIGTGIGLYSVKKVVENHDGSIVLHSSLNKGTSFEIILPC